MVYITDIETNKVYCKVVARSADFPVNMSLCLFTATGFLNAGVYSIMAYDVQSDGNVQVPVIIGATITIQLDQLDHLFLLYFQVCVYFLNLTSCTTNTAYVTPGACIQYCCLYYSLCHFFKVL